MYSLLEKVDFHCHVSLLEGTFTFTFIPTLGSPNHPTTQASHLSTRLGRLLTVASASAGPSATAAAGTLASARGFFGTTPRSRLDARAGQVAPKLQWFLNKKATSKFLKIGSWNKTYLGEIDIIPKPKPFPMNVEHELRGFSET